mmetsp:Transcript_104521/g.336872  ORF Transcript_104521/g.336872 Transcript_104521/m.336872 type:complete len:634 (+) Transcript_104521:57-1958(+)
MSAPMAHTIIGDEGVASACEVLVGSLEEVLPGIVRLQRTGCRLLQPQPRLLPGPHAVSFGCADTEFYIAPWSEVGPDVLAAGAENPYLGPQRPGFRGTGAKVRVGFRAAGLSVHGERRARAVHLLDPSMTCVLGSVAGGSSSSSSSPLPPSLPPLLLPMLLPFAEEVASAQASTAGNLRWPHGPKDAGAALENVAVAVPASAAADGRPPAERGPRISELERGPLFASGLEQVERQWMALRTPEELDAAVATLEAALRFGLSAGRGAILCAVLLRAAAALAVPDGVSRATGRTGLVHIHLQLWLQKRLRCVALGCLESLDLAYSGVLWRVTPALWRLRRLLAQSDGGVAAASAGCPQWRQIDSHVSRALALLVDERQGSGARRMCRIYQTCNVEGCASRASRRRGFADEYGKSGSRCRLHWYRSEGPSCIIPGCTRKRAGKVSNADEHGQPGRRCCRHGGRQCSLPDCSRMAVATVTAEDEHGRPGRRCFVHGFQAATKCSSPGCCNQPHGSARVADNYGPPGRRCQLHGADQCSVAGCKNHAWGRAGTPDEYGPMGLRCWVHGGVACSARGCNKQPVRKVSVQDKLGPVGARCHSHSGGRAPRDLACVVETTVCMCVCVCVCVSVGERCCRCR